jgi:arginine metabolism regulation protein II
MLHQIFLFQRIIEESTFIYPWLATCAPPAGPTQLEYRALRYPSLQTVYFIRGIDPPRSFPGALEAVLRGSSTGGVDNPSMFEEIYGIPETLLSLLSKATSLSNEIRAHKGQDDDPLLDPDLIVRSKELETNILRWRIIELGMDDASYVDSLANLDTESDSGLSDIGSSGEPTAENQAQDAATTLGLQASTSLNLAIHHGILIYYYRRIPNLDPSLLQFHVDAIMKLLRHCRHEMKKVGIINCGIVWPGFLAAAEALGCARQASIRSFLRESTRISGMRSFDIAMDVAEEVWRLRAEKGNAAVSWVHVLAEQGRTVVLT